MYVTRNTPAASFQNFKIAIRLLGWDGMRSIAAATAINILSITNWAAYQSPLRRNLSWEQGRRKETSHPLYSHISCYKSVRDGLVAEMQMVDGWCISVIQEM